MSIADLPYLHAAGDGGPRAMTQMIVVHATDNTAAAQAEASYATRRPDRTSAHFYIDGLSAYRALPLGNIAFGCHPIGNSRSVQFELCGLSNQISDATLRQAAPLVAEACRVYGIPIRKVSPAELVNGVKGICGHLDVTAAWHEGDHTDPGPNFPWATFIGYVQAATGGVDDMTPEEHDAVLNAARWAGDVLTFNATPQNALAQRIVTINNNVNAVAGKVDALAAKVGQPAPVALSDADRDDLAARTAAKLGSTLAGLVADEVAKRLGNG